eukprot:TRINITY_DN11928_c0_g1_i1.p1 TRINITY_DN11928_c0_g1~~TRINITY_DN11928_c0_g1_i1.p1  ORF type:complete len:513 (+),score=60.89 TRINITY_DN11928_c0_g1_i1:43-1581(+)
MSTLPIYSKSELLRYHSESFPIPKPLLAHRELYSQKPKVPESFYGLGEGRFTTNGLPPRQPEGFGLVSNDIWNIVFSMGTRFLMANTCKWFFNLAWETLSTVTFGPSQNLTEVRTVLSRCNPSLYSICLPQSKISAKQIDWLFKFKQLQELDLNHSLKVDCKDFGQLFDHLYNLTSVDLTGCSLKDQSLMKLAKCTHLRCLNIGFTSIDKGLSILRGFTNLEKLGLEYLTNINYAIDHLTLLQSLKCLNIAGATIKNLNWITSLTQLKQLNLSKTTFNTYEPLSHLTNLEDLNLGYTPLTNFPFIQYLSNLSRLEMNGNITSNGSGFKYLTGLDNLQFLDIRLSSYPELSVGFSALKYSMSGLTHIDVSYCMGFNDLCLEYMNAWTSIEILILKGTRVTERGLIWIESYVNLRVLDMSDCVGVTDADLSSISSHQNLETLMVGSGIADPGISFLQNLYKLKTLSFIQSNITVKAFKYLIPLASKNKLEVIFDRCPLITNAQEKYFLEQLNKN